MQVKPVRRTASVRNLDEWKTAPSNCITYTIGQQTSCLESRMVISGVEYSLDMKTVFGGPDDIRTIIFPVMVRTIQQGAFAEIWSLRSVTFNDGIEALGMDERRPDEEEYPGVF